MSRGALTGQVQSIAKQHIGREITLRELRLVPYVHYVMCNDQKLDPRKINEEERGILRQWKDAGWIEGGAGGLRITKPFWDFMCDVLFMSYVCHGEYLPLDNTETNGLQGEEPTHRRET